MKVYLDSSSGLVPAIATGKELDVYGRVLNVTVTITADRPGWHRGDKSAWPPSHVVPRDCVYRSRQACGQFRIRPYDAKAVFAALPQA